MLDAARMHERRPALVGRVGREPLTCAHDELLVPRVGLVERAHGHRDCGRLAGRRAPVRLERMTESAVGVAEGGHRVADRSSISAEKESFEAATVEDAGVAGEKPGGGVDVGSRHRVHPREAANLPSARRSDSERSAVGVQRWLTAQVRVEHPRPRRGRFIVHSSTS
jgi:hypothetical protein